MHVKNVVILVAAAFLFLLVTSVHAGHGAKSAHKTAVIEGGDQVTISGTILDSQQEPIDEAVVRVSLNSDKGINFNCGIHENRLSLHDHPPDLAHAFQACLNV